VTIGSATAPVAPATSIYDSFEYDDMISLESQLAAQYLIGDDIQGSGIVTGSPQYWLAHALKQSLKKKKDGIQNYTPEARELRSESKIFGYGAQRVLSLPDGTASSAADKVAVFGNLAFVWCGVEPGYRIDLLTEGSIDDGGSLVSLADTGQIGVRVIEWFDSVVIDPSALSIAVLGA
jgi:hypothetical protein